MNVSDWTIRLALVLTGTVVALLVLGQLLGQPLLLSYVTSDSMEPTIDEGDGYVAVPIEIAGPVEEGDVIVFEARELHGGSWTTHRVVEETDRGYVTRGDANPFTDQDRNEPPVQEGQVGAKALRVNGEIVTIPHLGTAVVKGQSALTTVQRHLASLLGVPQLLGARGLGYLLGVLALLAYLVDVFVHRNAKRSSRTRSRDDGTDVRLLLAAFACLLMVSATAAMIAPAGTERIDMVSAEFESERPAVIEQGESSELTYELHNGGVLPVVSYFETGSDDVEVHREEVYLGRGERAETTVTLHAPAETGHYPQYVTERRYLAILPRDTLRSLYEFHPWAPILVIDALLGGSFYALGSTLVGRGRVRTRSRDAGGRNDVRRFLRRLY